MDEATLSSDLGRRLASYIEDRRRELVASAVRSPLLPQLGSSGSAAFADGFLVRLGQELRSGNRLSVDGWAAAEADVGDSAEHGRLITTVCAVLSAGFVADCGQSDDAISYLALRSSEVAHHFRGAGIRTPKDFDPAKIARRDDVVSSFLSAMEARDRATCEHARAVGMWCNRIAKTIGAPAGLQAQATLAGTMHDVGKIATPSEILLKPGPLDASEWEQMHAHARIGAKMLERVPSLQDLAAVVRGHHERMDGRGYPDGLVGEAIPLLARIVAVADAFHAMISKRPYRDALPVPRALDELRAGSGSQWDPVLVDAMLTIVRPALPNRLARAAAGGC